MNAISRVSIILAIAAIGGCADSPPFDLVVRSDSAGVEIVHNPVRDQLLAWTLQPDTIIGGSETGPDSFFRVASGLVDADAFGNIYILDPTNLTVSRFDSRGVHQWSAGRQGGGPGELLSGNSISASSMGDAWVQDGRKNALVGFDSHGNPLPQVEFPYGIISGWFPSFHVVPGGFAVMNRDLFGAGNDAPIRVLRAIGEDTTVLLSRSLALTNTASPTGCGFRLTMPILFGPQPLWAQSGDQLAIITGAEYRVEIYDQDKLSRVVVRPLEPKPVSEEAAVEYLEARQTGPGPMQPCNLSIRERLDTYGFAGQLQMISAVALDPAGYLWVRRAESVEDRAGPIDVFDPSGVYLGTLRPEFPFPVVFLSGDRIGYLETSDLDVDRIRLAAVMR